MTPACAGGGVGLATTMGALYTGRGPVCGITTRLGATAGRSGARGASGVCGVFGSGVSLGAAGASFAFAAISAACPTGVSTTGGAGGTADAVVSTFSCTGGADGGATTGAAAFGAAGFAGAADSPALGCACVAPAAGVTGGFTTTVGGTTVTWRTGAAPAGALATTAPAGGFDAMAGAGGGIIAGAGRGCGTILRGSGRAAAAGGAATETTGGAGLAGALVTTGVTALLGGTWLLRASASCSCFLARMAFITSPGLETWERSILGVMPWEAREDPAPLWLPWRPCWNCARTFSAS